MRNTSISTASIFVRLETDDVTVPAGDRGEQLIAHLILCAIAFDLRSDTVGRRHLARAHLLAVELADQSFIYRPARPSQFARLTCELNGHSQTILLPVINNILVLPSVAAEEIVGDDQPVPPAVNVAVFEIARFRLRLRPRRIASILESLDNTAPTDRLADAARRILTACTRHELPVGEPLDRANDSLTLARDLIGKRNFPLATLALTNAGLDLESFARTASTDYAALVQAMKRQIQQMLGQMQRTAM
jgi:hypothetical protein